MKLDLRRPTLVLAGAWNPAIFEPAWIVRHVFGMPPGVEVTMNVAQMIDEGEPKLVIYIKNVGFSVSPTRLQVFAVDAGQSAFDAIESVTAKIVELLPHTPITAFGINFRFVEGVPSPGLLKKIRGHDELEKRFEVTKESIASSINLEPKVQLNLHRQKDGSSLMFNFNFHHSGVELDSISQSIRGQIQVRLGEAMSIMEDIYGLSSYEVLIHQFDSGQGGQE